MSRSLHSRFLYVRDPPAGDDAFNDEEVEEDDIDDDDGDADIHTPEYTRADITQRMYLPT